LTCCIRIGSFGLGRSVTRRLPASWKRPSGHISSVCKTVGCPRILGRLPAFVPTRTSGVRRCRRGRQVVQVRVKFPLLSVRHMLGPLPRLAMLVLLHHYLHTHPRAPLPRFLHPPSLGLQASRSRLQRQETGGTTRLIRPWKWLRLLRVVTLTLGSVLAWHHRHRCVAPPQSPPVLLRSLQFSPRGCDCYTDFLHITGRCCILGCSQFFGLHGLKHNHLLQKYLSF